MPALKGNERRGWERRGIRRNRGRDFRTTMESGRSGGLLGFNEAAAVVALEAGASAGAQRRAFWERRRRQQGNEAVGWVPRELGVGSSALGYLPTGTARAAATALGLEWFTADHQRAPPASNLALCIYYSCGPPARPTRSRRNDRALSGSCVASPLLSSPPLWRSVLTRASSLLVRLPWRAPCSLGQGCAWVGGCGETRAWWWGSQGSPSMPQLRRRSLAGRPSARARAAIASRGAFFSHHC